MAPRTEGRLRVAAAGDIHCREANPEEAIAAFAELGRVSDLVLLAGDLTSHGTAEEAEILCEAVAPLGAPVYAVLGNHDWQGGEAGAIAGHLREAGVGVLEREASACEIDGIEVGVAGCKAASAASGRRRSAPAHSPIP